MTKKTIIVFEEKQLPDGRSVWLAGIPGTKSIGHGPTKQAARTSLDENHRFNVATGFNGPAVRSLPKSRKGFRGKTFIRK